MVEPDGLPRFLRMRKDGCYEGGTQLRRHDLQKTVGAGATVLSRRIGQTQGEGQRPSTEAKLLLKMDMVYPRCQAPQRRPPTLQPRRPLPLTQRSDALVAFKNSASSPASSAPPVGHWVVGLRLATRPRTFTSCGGCSRRRVPCVHWRRYSRVQIHRELNRNRLKSCLVRDPHASFRDSCSGLVDARGQRSLACGVIHACSLRWLGTC